MVFFVSCLQSSLIYSSAQEAILTMNNSPIAARNDGSLQIQVYDPEPGGRMFWSRQYYVVPLEVLGPFPPYLNHFPPFTTVTYCRQNATSGKEKTRKPREK